ncbi:amidohydrolase family protein [Lacibacter sediminis]|uniref:Amidohydrolase family protein n=1 Tax=Lacibacter sediminis TaxID=2760713 RepID=A0A7G5XF68_9BACT|nr:amidohydrolase family protein [Lacibacter sediminis]QNA44121.1 amidohydrolase family protein [Lacibacter sediminis]
MRYRKLRADRLFDGYRFRNDDDVLVTDEEGVVLDIVAFADAGADVEQLKGILSPGLINCHCHLELSHLKNVIPPHTGLIDFLCSVVTKRGFEADIVAAAIAEAEKEMFKNGTVAVGDIGNTADTAFTKSKSKIRWQNFVEVLGFYDAKAEENINNYQVIANELNTVLRTSNFVHRTSLVPHAPYSVSAKTFQLINEATAGQIISIHNQENPEEDELYITGGGDFLKLFRVFGIDASPFPVTGKSSISSYLPFFNNGQTIFLVHNTFMPEEDIVWANEYATTQGLKLVYCLCPNANLYIENQVPPVSLFQQHNCELVLGTDSYSSNWQLSIAKEIQALLQHTAVSTEQALQMATINGAKALQWDNELGSFEKGKQPGVVLFAEDFSSSERIV